MMERHVGTSMTFGFSGVVVSSGLLIGAIFTMRRGQRLETMLLVVRGARKRRCVWHGSPLD